jgi:F-type H+-transporting ATPase subunit gamma
MSHAKKAAFDDAQAIAQDLIARFERGEFDVAHLVFSKFQSALVQEPTLKQLIPVPLDASVPAETGAGAAVTYEPDEEAILADLLPKNVAIQLYRALLENQAGFYGSQMTAMDNATRNAGDMINRLSIAYNRQRQAAITTELVEIISGAEAL